MKTIDLPLSKLTVAQKLQLIEAIWDDLSKDQQSLESPRWHEDVLRDRGEALEEGKATVSGWEEAKDRVRKNVSCK